MRAPWMRFLLVVAVGTAPLTLAPAFADCSAPSFELETTEASLGDEVRFSGRDFFAECNDTPGPCQRGGVSGPIEGIQIVVTQGSISYPVATVSANDNFEFSGSFRLPDIPASEGVGFEPGPAQVVATADGRVWTQRLTIRP